MEHHGAICRKRVNRIRGAGGGRRRGRGGGDRAGIGMGGWTGGIRGWGEFERILLRLGQAGGGRREGRADFLAERIGEFWLAG